MTAFSNSMCFSTQLTTLVCLLLWFNHLRHLSGTAGQPALFLVTTNVPDGQLQPFQAWLKPQSTQVSKFILSRQPKWPPVMWRGPVVVHSRLTHTISCAWMMGSFTLSETRILMTLVIQKHTENISRRGKLWLVLTSWPLKLTSRERGGVSKLPRSIKPADDGVHPSAPVTVWAVFPLFSLINRSRRRCSLTGALRRQEVSIIGGLIYSIRWVSEARWRLLRNYYICFQTSLFARWTVEDPQHFCANWWFYESWERPESGRASGHNNPPRGGGVISFFSPPCRNSWKMTLAWSSASVFGVCFSSKHESRKGFRCWSHFSLLAL